uniref:Uncharacterized protein n=1 Tax=Candidatus Methanogaster sp. ANME-2c ERB4 TaxID=2759911 RepID=A0A7G9YAX1_9EURY|nr:hypothetical protein GMDKAGHH_00008 [Methanosarcinales archaeon ANME-2c ERB4]QNO46043.1 hypothetical protein OOGCPJEC_00028 [Methanosarcinales archaeon ANME-2c ERB4]
MQAQTDVGWVERARSAHNYGAGDAVNKWFSGILRGSEPKPHQIDHLFRHPISVFQRSSDKLNM